MRLRFWQPEEEPWRGEAETSRPWVEEAESNLAAAELDVRKTRALYDKAIDDVLRRGEEVIAELEERAAAASDRLERVEGIVDRLDGSVARTTEARLQAIEQVLRVELGVR